MVYDELITKPQETDRHGTSQDNLPTPFGGEAFDGEEDLLRRIWDHYEGLGVVTSRCDDVTQGEGGDDNQEGESDNRDDADDMDEVATDEHGDGFIMAHGRHQGIPKGYRALAWYQFFGRQLVE